MSQETVRKFFEVVQNDEPAAERLRAASENADEFARLSTELGRERGFAFDASDVLAALAALIRQNESELSEEDLSAVAGGSGMISVGCGQAGTDRLLSGGCAARYSEGCQTTGLFFTPTGNMLTKGR